MEDIRNKKRKNKTMIISGIILLIICLLLFFSLSYAWLRTSVKGTKNVGLNAKKLNLILDETNDGIDLGSEVPAVPIVDEEGKKGVSYTFTLDNESMMNLDYQLSLIDNEEKQQECPDCSYLDEKDIRYQLIANGKEEVETLPHNRIIDAGTILKGEANKIDYELRVWLNYDAGNDAQGKVFFGKLKVDATQQLAGYENQQEPNPPVLSDNMIPVVYNGYSWIKADVNNKWYDYDKQNWANAVTVTNETRETYKNAKAGAKINMDDILQMFVWIPRYSYTIKSEDGTNYYGKGGESAANPGEIDVKFISTSTKDDGTAQYKKGQSVKGWFTPPGFTFGDENLSGVWIGKFESSNIENCSTTNNDVNNGCDLENLTVQIKPNVYSWRNIRVSTLEIVSMGITKVGNIYGFNQETYDSHASKNTEWALISYLTQSKYGKYGNSLYTGANKEVFMNNYSGYKTGRSSGQGSALSSTEEGAAYDDLVDRGEGKGYTGAGASSTGNITGIYDINGGAWEYTMGVLEKRSGNAQERNSGYSGKLTDESEFTENAREWPATKYFDEYTSILTETACNGNSCKGHSLGEGAEWYSDLTWMVNTDSPWMIRGGYPSNGQNAGVFAFSGDNGRMTAWLTFRIVLTPNAN